MSYRELRNFTEIMRSLGYPRLISVENFRKPNFELIADILYWMVKLYDPETTLSDRVEFENERVEFLTEIAALMAAKARLKLNTKKLYASDGRAVQELLKLATILNKASKNSRHSNSDDAPPPPIKVQEVKAARSLASDITQRGAKLYDLLSTEVSERLERNQALRFLDLAGSSLEGSKEHAFIERSLRELIDQSHQAVEDMRKECEEMELDEKNIESKIRKKQEELERTEKRLRSLENVRPQFMDEQEKLERELQRHYDVYMEKYRNLDYLENELEAFHKNEEERKEEQERRLKKMRERLLKEEVAVLRGNRNVDDDDDDGPMLISGKGFNSDGQFGGRGGGQSGRGGSGSRVSGSMMNGGSDDGESSEADSDDEENSGDSGDDRDSDEDDDDEELSVNSELEPGRGGNNGMRGRSGRGGSDDEDSDDFLDDDDDDDDDDVDGDHDDDSGSDDQF
mmetsp:Transcript_23700/g.40332  ORF Transcript_23700/g.40332 Transcript_23700/m.40332 type:complete len:456 (-) Transcript_23700:182-1549(-)